MTFKPHLLLLSFCLLLSSCTSLVFQPDNNQYYDLELNKIQFQDIYFNTSNNIKLHGWFLPSKKSTVSGTILFLHGNAQNISSHVSSVFWLPDYGFNVFLFDYQGYGKSEGEPSLTALQQDFHASLEWLITNSSIENNKIIIYGQSLGAAVALYGLSKSKHKNKIRGIIADSTFTSYRNIAQDFLDKFWLTWVLQWPLSLTISNEYPPIEAISKISPIPLLIIHSKEDEIIPYSHGEKLFTAAKAPKFFWSLQDTKHIQVSIFDKNRKIIVHHLNSMLKNSFPSAIPDK